MNRNNGHSGVPGKSRPLKICHECLMGRCEKADKSLEVVRSWMSGGWQDGTLYAYATGRSLAMAHAYGAMRRICAE